MNFALLPSRLGGPEASLMVREAATGSSGSPPNGFPPPGLRGHRPVTPRDSIADHKMQ
jgi:hypothetical protein